MSVINATPLLAAAGGDYQISRSVRLRSSASAYFNRTPGSASNRKTWTWSGWVKRGALGASQVLFGASNASSSQMYLRFTSSDTLEFVDWATTTQAQRSTSAVYRDPSAHMHVVLQFDTTQAVASDRVRLYVNGAQVTAFSTTVNPSQNFDGACNSTVSHSVGREEFSDNQWFDGYLTEVNFIDGQALTPSSFGETDSITGVWKPKKYAGTYGTNGFYLNFSDNSAATAATIGKDYSGNGNNWTPNNISVTAGATYDSMLDVPTLWADGGNGRGNYATLNPLDSYSSSTLSDGNLKQSAALSGYRSNASIRIPASGLWYAEFINSSASNSNTGIGFGVSTDSVALSGASNASGSYHFYASAVAQVVNSGTGTTISSWTNSANQTFQLAVDVDSGKVWVGQNNVWFNSTGGTTGNPSTGANPTFTVAPAGFKVFTYIDSTTTINWQANFGQRPFAYTPPTGFKALNTQNLPEPTIKKGNQWFDATTYTGTGASLSVTNSGSMQPDLVWLKSRNSVENNFLFDSVRGASPNYVRLCSNLTDAEATPGVAMLTAINSNGFTLGTNGGVNTNTNTYVGWQWKESPSAGFDIVTYTGDGNPARTVSHSLGVTPAMIIVKTRGSANDWFVKHKSLPSGTNLILNATSGLYTCSAGGGGGLADLTSSTSFGFINGTSNVSNANGSGLTYVAYLFAEVAGFSKFGSYVGNGSSTDGPFVFCGFRPRFVMYKRTDTTGDWIVHDASRNVTNLTNNLLYPNTSAAEAAASGAVSDFLSNGFKLRGASPDINGGTIIFMAFAEHPAKYALAR